MYMYVDAMYVVLQLKYVFKWSPVQAGKWSVQYILKYVSFNIFSNMSHSTQLKQYCAVRSNSQGSQVVSKWLHSTVIAPVQAGKVG